MHSRAFIRNNKEQYSTRSRRVREITFQEAAMEALREEFMRDEKTIYYATAVNMPLRHAAETGVR